MALFWIDACFCTKPLQLTHHSGNPQSRVRKSRLTFHWIHPSSFRPFSLFSSHVFCMKVSRSRWLSRWERSFGLQSWQICTTSLARLCSLLCRISLHLGPLQEMSSHLMLHRKRQARNKLQIHEQGNPWLGKRGQRNPNCLEWQRQCQWHWWSRWQDEGTYWYRLRSRALHLLFLKQGIPECLRRGMCQKLPIKPVHSSLA